VVLERQQCEELRVKTKAGLIEPRVVAALRPFGLDEPILKRGGRNGIAEFRIDGKLFVFDYGRLTEDGKGHFVYAQNELVADWAEALTAAGGEIRFGVRVTNVAQDANGVEVRATRDPNASWQPACASPAPSTALPGIPPNECRRSGARRSSRTGCSASFTPSTRRAPTAIPAPRISLSGGVAAGSTG